MHVLQSTDPSSCQVANIYHQTIQAMPQFHCYSYCLFSHEDLMTREVGYASAWPQWCSWTGYFLAAMSGLKIINKSEQQAMKILHLWFGITSNLPV